MLDSCFTREGSPSPFQMEPDEELAVRRLAPLRSICSRCRTTFLPKNIMGLGYHGTLPIAS
jgi:hypothetical protein